MSQSFQPEIPFVPTPSLPSPMLKKTLAIKENVPQLPKKIALTFDDGPHPVYTERLLSILKENGVSATFFVVGKQVEKYPQLLQMIFEQGHELANHSYSHRDMRTLKEDELQLELEKTHELVESMTAQKMRFFRPPGGQHDQQVLGYARNLGYEMVLWTIFPQDHSNPPTELIRKRILKNARANGIILLHSGVENTLEILPNLISELKKMGFTFVMISDL